jgi:hypothetical protein
MRRRGTDDRRCGVVAYGVSMSEPTHDTTPNDTRPRHDPDGTDEQSEGQVSEGPSGFGSAETSGGGADAVPDTPDANPGTSAPIRGSRD